MRKLTSYLPFLSLNVVKYAVLSLTLISCASVGLNQVDLEKLYGKVFVPERNVAASSLAGQHYLNDVAPILEQRCVTCHGCYDAPCQLKLSSPEGIARGASKKQVYDGTRIISADPTRLNIDARTTEQWREKGFHSILNERSQTEITNLENSLLYQMLELKRRNPQPNTALLDKTYSLGLDRKQFCSSPEEFDEFASKNPNWGMPYGLPALTEQEHNTLRNWIASGAPSANPNIPTDIQTKIEKWESFLNEDSLKQQLVSRYIYEHIFLGHIHFSDTKLFGKEAPSTKPEFFFRLVRSSTPPGLPIRTIPSRRPYHSPGLSRVYYRLQAINGSIPSKVFMPYSFNDQRMEWIKELFINPNYTVNTLPGYDEEDTVNPLLTFKDLPIGSRYRFMLEEAEFIIKGFIKGPVCRGQIALNVIDDHFWVNFIDPKYQSSEGLNKFLVSESENLKLPGETSQKTQNVVKWLLFSRAHERFLKAKNNVIRERFEEGKSIDLDLVWAGGKTQNPNAALTIFRHFDSATVIQGHVGQTPKTAWLIGYPLLERIHYLLVAQFDVYGNIGHQLLTRLYMDFLRMEGEYNFLAFLPQEERIKLTEYWYRRADQNLKDHLFQREKEILQTPNIDYQTESPKTELLTMIANRLGSSLSDKYALNNSNSTHQQLAVLNNIKGKAANIMPEASIVFVNETKDTTGAFTIIRNSGHYNISSLLHEEKNRNPEEDYLSVIPGIVTSYPAAFFKVNKEDISDFTKRIASLKSELSYYSLKTKYGVRRTHPEFWNFSDKLYSWLLNNDPMNSGVLDYNRLENR